VELSGGDWENVRYSNCCISARLDGTHLKNRTKWARRVQVPLTANATKRPHHGPALIPQLDERVVVGADEVARGLACANVQRPHLGPTSLGQNGPQTDNSSGTQRAPVLGQGALARRENKVMTYVMTKPCPVCKQQLTKKVPTDTVQCACGQHVWQG
jgi:hypothetical protein